MNKKNKLIGIYMGILLVFMIGIVSANNLQADQNQQVIIKTYCSGADATADIMIYSGTTQDPNNLIVTRTAMTQVSPTDFTYTTIFSSTGIYTAYEECTYGGGFHSAQTTTITVTELINLIKPTTQTGYDYEALLYYDVYFKADPTQPKTIDFRLGTDSITFQPTTLAIIDGRKTHKLSDPLAVTGYGSDNIFSYQDIYGTGLTLEYLINTKYVKEQLVIASTDNLPVNTKADYLELNSIMTTTTNHIIVDGIEWNQKKAITTSNKILINDAAGNTIYQLQVPVAYDTDGAKLLGTYTLKKDKDKILVSVKMDYAWFKDAARVYPIYLDPTIDTPDGTATFQSGIPRTILGNLTIAANEPYLITEQILMDTTIIYDAECELDIIDQATGLDVVHYRSLYNDGQGTMSFLWGQPNTENNPTVGTYTLNQYCWHGVTLDLNKIYSTTTITVI